MSIEKSWHRYVHNDVNGYSATTQWKSAQIQNAELMDNIPKGVKRVLDLGCGDGWGCNELKRRGYEVLGITVNPKEYEHAKRVYNADVCVKDAHDLEGIEDRRFDCVYCRECIEHLVAPFIGLCEINRVLIMGGYLLAHLPNQSWMHDNSHYSCMDEAQFREMLRKTLFTALSSGTTPSGYFVLAQKTGSVT
jgi:SAM-dependent methyltransferase